MKSFTLLAAMVFSGVALAAAQTAERRSIAIGTGGVTGVYYPIGGAICRLVEQDRETHGIRCSAESTGGSIYNIETLRRGELEFGVAQSDRQFDAYRGRSRFEAAGPFEGLRSVFSVHAEPITLVARAGSGIAGVADLKGRRLNVGPRGTGQRATIERVLEAHGIRPEDLSLAAELRSADMSRALCDGEIDAMLYTIGHPAPAITEASNACDIEFVDVAGPVVERLIADNAFYRKAVVPKGLYRGLDADLQTFGVGATLVSSAAVPDDIVYIVTRAVFEHLDDFRRLHPAFADLKEAEMISDGLSAPLHDGAVRYYRERGWM